MVTEDKILTELYKILNVPIVTDSINGLIYKGEKPFDRQAQDIVIGLLTNQNLVGDRVQIGVININIFCIETSFKTRDNQKLNEITENVLTALNTKDGIGRAVLFNYRLDEIKTFRDNDDKQMFYQNIKLKFSYKI